MIQALDRPRLGWADAQRLLEAEAQQGTYLGPRYQCEYATWGQGPALVFVHGLADRWRTFLLPLALLRHEYRCIAYNQPIGLNDGSRLRGYTHDQLVDDLLGLLDHLGVRQAYLLGHSFGSTVVLKALARHPERFPRGVLVNGFAHRPLRRMELLLTHVGRLWPGQASQVWLREPALRRSHEPFFQGLEPERWAFFLEQAWQMPMRAVGHWALQLHRTDVRPLLADVRQPVLLVCGDRDPLVAFARQKILFERLPNAAMFQIENCGHLVPLTHPEALASVVRQFLTPALCTLVRHAS
jgi:pimeloyl-ACP methyl ester carboxylesterase